MIAIHVSPRGVEDVQVIADSDYFEALDLAILPIICNSLEKLDRRLRRITKAAEALKEQAREGL